MANQDKTKYDVGDRIVAAFADLDVVQSEIPPGHALHVSAHWNEGSDSPLPFALLLEVKPQDDVPANAVQLP